MVEAEDSQASESQDNMNGKAFDAIFLDFYGTVVGGDRRAVEGVCRRVVTELGLSAAPTEFAIRWGEQFFSCIESCHGEQFATLREIEFLSLRTTLGESAEGVDLSTFVADLDAYWANPPIHDDAVEFLRSVDVPVCCVSNADEKPLKKAIEKHGLMFSEVISSESVRSYKPNVKIFQTALDRMSCVPGRVLHVGDSLHSDIAGGAAAGLKTAWVCRSERIHDIGVANPSYSITNLHELQQIIARER